MSRARRSRVAFRSLDDKGVERRARSLSPIPWRSWRLGGSPCWQSPAPWARFELEPRPPLSVGKKGYIIAMPNNNPREGFHTVTPRMVVADAAGAVQFLRDVFDGTGEYHEIDPPSSTSAIRLSSFRRPGFVRSFQHSSTCTSRMPTALTVARSRPAPHRSKRRSKRRTAIAARWCAIRSERRQIAHTVDC